MDKNISIFCRVVDNFGDIGVCWRLAQSLSQKSALSVHLWVDDLLSFKAICTRLDPALTQQTLQQVVVHHWHEAADFAPALNAAVIIEAFACELPPGLQASLATDFRQYRRQPVWINLEYLSAEPWVETCHAMVSTQPQTGLRKYFYFPGFSEKTGGLLFEPAQLAALQQFQENRQAQREFLSQLGVPDRPDAKRYSLFCYASAPVLPYLRQLQETGRAVQVLVAQGVASQQLQELTGLDLQAGQRWQGGNLSIECLPFIDQADYEYLLACCDLNLVRGEDSFVRAQLLGIPMLWHIYPQEQQAHCVKLQAFLELYLAELQDAALRSRLQGLFYAWNQMQELNQAELDSLFDDAGWQALAQAWQRKILQNGDLASRLLQFIEEIG